jgi:predicted SAM-dependent methyltransferase
MPVNGSPFSDGAITHVHCEHFPEHLDYSVANAFLADCSRVLKPSGSMGTIVPDVQRIEVINQMFRTGGAHRFDWDLETLRHASSKAGISKTASSSKGNVAIKLAIDGHDDCRELESLYANLYK